MKIVYSFTGNFDKRPAALQIYQNYSNALMKAGGEVLYNDDVKGLYGKLKKAGDLFWIKVSTDGSGFYWLETVKEAPLRQDVVLTANDIKTILSADGKVSFYGIFFDTDKTIVKPESAPALKEIAEFLKANPAVNVFIVGHTDNSGEFNKNLILSKERAIAVLNELIFKYAVNKQQLTAEGVASLAPVAPNDTNEGKAKNRRVEIVMR